MADRYWVGVDNDWFTDSNWSTTSGGAGNGAVPIASDEVYFDGNGYTLCQPDAPFVCNSFSMLAGATESFLPSQGGVINGDFSIAAGYFGPTGGGGYTVEFAGDWIKTGGTFAVGTGTGVDPICEFSKTGGDYQLNDTGSAAYQNVLISGTISMSGTRLVVMNISQELDITGEMDIAGDNRVDLDGGPLEISGTLTGDGRFTYNYPEGATVPTTGTIDIRYFHFQLEGPTSASINDTHLAVNSWTNVQHDWTDVGTEPWVHDDDGDGNYISIPADASVGDKDEYYEFESLDSKYTSVTPTNVRIHFKARLYEGSIGAATIIALKGWLWDGTTWQDGGTALFNSTSYADDDCSINLSGSFDTKAKIDAARLRIEVSFIIGGGTEAEYGGIRVTQAYLEIDGTAEWNPICELAPRVWTDPCEIELEYTGPEHQTFQLDAGVHRFGSRFTIYNDAGSDGTLDCAENDAQMYVWDRFDVDNDAFQNATFTWNLGDGIHLFRHTVSHGYFAYGYVNSRLVVNAGNGMIILWPRGITRILLP